MSISSASLWRRFAEMVRVDRRAAGRGQAVDGMDLRHPAPVVLGRALMTNRAGWPTLGGRMTLVVAPVLHQEDDAACVS